MEEVYTKICKFCGEEKDINTFGLRGNGTQNRRPICNVCRNEIRRKRHEEKQREFIGKNPKPSDFYTHKICKKCNEKKSLDNFHAQKRGFLGKRSVCIECTKEARKIYSSINGEQIKEKNRTYKREKYHENPLIYIKRAHHYYHKNKSERKEINRLTKSNWRRKNHLKVTEYASRRRAIIKERTIGIVNYSEILQRDNGRCGICGGFVEPENLSFDHILPLAKGGSHSEENVQVAHSLCNSIKSDNIIR